MISIALPLPIVTLIVGAILCGIVIGAAFLVALVIHAEQSGGAGALFVGTFMVLGVAYGVGWAALTFL